MESELFGFEKGAFTGADLRKPGKFDLANGGTILLNEIGEIDISVQPKLLQVLQDGEYSRLGGEGDVQVNIRVITTTKDLLERSLMEGRFREDLFFRINVMSITLPPLRARRDQIPPLSQYFFNIYAIKYSKAIAPLSSKMLSAIQDYEWPGNIRELENLIKRIVLFGEDKVISSLRQGDPNKELPPFSAAPRFSNEGGTKSLKKVGREAAELAEKNVIQGTLQETHWNRKKSAQLLGVSYKALLYKIQKYRLDAFNSLSRMGGEME
jgi:two-component system response regulator AtoC